MFFLGGVIPVVLGGILGEYFPDWRWDYEPAHAIVEGIGSFSALIIATLILMMLRHHKLPPSYIWVTAGLLGMGVMDGFHAALYESNAFVWLHSLATFTGGVFFALVWIPDALSQNRFAKNFPALTLVGAITISCLSIIFPQWLPQMVANNDFTPLPKALNIVGGIGFLMAAICFLLEKKKTIIDNRSVFSTHAFLFGVAGILFELSVLWDPAWWLWHFLRLIAYLVAVCYFFLLFYQQETELRIANEQLEQKVKIRTEELRYSRDKMSVRVEERTLELKAAKEVADQANRAKSVFLCSMSHELRTPLNAILGYAQLLLLSSKDEITEGQSRKIQKIINGGQHLLELVDDILDLSGIEAGKLTLSLEPINIKKMINDCMPLANILAKKNNITIEICSNEVCSSFEADYLRVKQVILNLISNAVKYNHEGGKVWIETEETEDGKIRIKVRDTGYGIDKEKQKELFQPFHRLGAEASNIEGTGIGLVLAKKLVEEMRGSISFKSLLGEGSTFWVEFPIQTEKDHEYLRM